MNKKKQILWVCFVCVTLILGCRSEPDSQSPGSTQFSDVKVTRDPGAQIKSESKTEPKPPGEQLSSSFALEKDTISIKTLQSRMEGPDSTFVNYFQGKLYTGKAVDQQQAPDGIWNFVYSLNNGIIYRLDVLSADGFMHRYVRMKEGRPYHMVMFHRNGQKYIEEYYDKNQKPIGHWKKWTESGVLEWEKKYTE